MSIKICDVALSIAHEEVIIYLKACTYIQTFTRNELRLLRTKYGMVFQVGERKILSFWHLKPSKSTVQPI